jgi:hypothetical protein
MARKIPSRTLLLQYVRLPDADHRLRQVFSLLATLPIKSAEPALDAPTTQREEENNDASSFVCPSL